MSVLQTLDQKDNVTPVILDGLETTVTHAHQVGLVMTVTPALTDGFLRPVTRSVMDSAAVTMENVKGVSRMEDGQDPTALGLLSLF